MYQKSMKVFLLLYKSTLKRLDIEGIVIYYCYIIPNFEEYLIFHQSSLNQFLQ